MAPNRSQLGDPVSLKAETSERKPVAENKRTLKEVAQQTNPSQLGDPVSLKAETSNNEPTENDRGALGTSKSSGKPKI